jgi:hypothetical protein
MVTISPHLTSLLHSKESKNKYQLGLLLKQCDLVFAVQTQIRDCASIYKSHEARRVDLKGQFREQRRVERD